jgi:phage terminase small subunit
MTALPTQNGEKLPTRQQQRLVDELISNGGDLDKAAEAAGYLTKHARAVAQGVLKKPHVIRYFRVKAVEVLSVQGVATALNRMVGLSAGARSEYVQYQASADILDRAGFRPPDRRTVVAEGSVTFVVDYGD